MIRAKSVRRIPAGAGVRAEGTAQIGEGTVSAVIDTIDLTTASADSRLTYAGPAHYYWAQDGTLKQSAANVWPLEYRNGVAVGRHEPEPLVNSWQAYNRGNVMNGTNGIENPAGTMTNGAGLAPDGGDIGTFPLSAANYLISQDSGSIDHVPQTPYGADLSNQWKRFVFPVRQTQLSRLRTWLARNTAGDVYAYLTQTGQFTARDWVFSWFAKKHPTDSARYLAGVVMIERENYPYATSPIFTADNAQNQRPASSVQVQAINGAVAVRVYFTDGTTKDYPFNGAQSVTLDPVSSHWGTRYITKIEYRRR